MSGISKWSDEAVKDLTFAILMSNNADGSIVVNANWDKVCETMNAWGYNFTKSAMSQHWTKKILKEFKERHTGNGDAPAPASATPKKAATPRKPRTPKAPGTGGAKKRAAEDDEDTASPAARNKTPRSTSKKVKYEETKDEQDHVSGDDSGAHETKTKAEGTEGDFGVA